MKTKIRIGTTLLILVALSGCATAVTTSPMLITTQVEQKHNETIAIVISDEDLSRSELVAMGIAGNLFPMKVEVGEFLRVSSEDTFRKLFKNVVIGEKNSDNQVALEIKKFGMMGINAKAHLELTVNIRNISGDVLLEKTYKADGSGHSPVYLNESNQKRQISKSTAEAFQLVFNDIATDVIGIEFN